MRVTVDANTYRLLGVEPYQRKRDGAWIELEQWESRCADCGAFFVAKVPAGRGLVNASRRCQACKAPGHAASAAAKARQGKRGRR